MRPRWWWVAGPEGRDGKPPTKHEREIADMLLDALLDDWYLGVYVAPRTPEPVARCTLPVQQCVDLSYAVVSGERVLCTRWPTRAEEVPPGAAPVQAGEVVTCDRMRIEPPKKGASRGKRRHGAPSQPVRVRSRDGIARWMDETLKQLAAKGDPGALAYLAGDEPDDEAKNATRRAIRKRAKRTGPPSDAGWRSDLVKLAIIADRRQRWA